MKKPKIKKSKINILSISIFIGFAILGFVCFLVGAYLAKRPIFEWLTSGTALLIYAIIILIILTVGTLLMLKKKDK